MNVLDLLEAALREQGYQGLYAPNDGGCSCGLDDLALCGGIQNDCRAGWLQPAGRIGPTPPIPGQHEEESE